MRISKVKDIIVREYTTRVKKKSFVITTVIGPFLMLVMMIVPYWFTSTSTQSSTYKVAVLNERSQVFQNNDRLSFDYIGSEYDASLFNIYDAVLDVPNKKWYYVTSNDLVFDYIHARLSLSSCGELLKIPIIGMERVIKTDDKKEAVRSFFSYGSSILIYFFIFLYGMQVMKGVIEEKNNRIIEVLITIVKPFELMIGKITGLGLLGLTQFLIWIAFYGGILFFLDARYEVSMLSDEKLQGLSSSVNLETFMDINALLYAYSGIQWIGALVWFFVCFVFGYLIFASLFAIVGAASDVDTETQQFIFPITIPLLGTLMFAEQIVSQPNSALARGLSYFPLTSPLASALRMEYIVMYSSWSEIVFILLSLSIGFLVIIWVASRVYRIGILSYGNRIGYLDLVRWVFRKD